MPTAHTNDNLGYALSGRSADISIMGLNGTHLHFTINTGMTHNTDSCSCSPALNIHRIGSVRERAGCVLCVAADSPGPGFYLRELCEWKAESYSQLVRSQTKKGNLYRTWLSVFFLRTGIWMIMMMMNQ